MPARSQEDGGFTPQADTLSPPANCSLVRGWGGSWLPTSTPQSTGAVSQTFSRSWLLLWRAGWGNRLLSQPSARLTKQRVAIKEGLAWLISASLLLVLPSTLWVCYARGQRAALSLEVAGPEGLQTAGLVCYCRFVIAGCPRVSLGAHLPVARQRRSGDG